MSSVKQYKAVNYIGYFYFEQETVNELITWVVYIVLPAFAGSFASDYFKTLKQDNMRISLIRVVLASVIAIIISLVLLDHFLNLTERRALVAFISIIFGLLGFEILYGLSSIENMVVLIKKVTALFSPIFALAKQVNELRTFTSNKYTHDDRKEKNNEGQNE